MFFYFSYIRGIPTPIPRIPTLIHHIPTQILHISALLPTFSAFPAFPPRFPVIRPLFPAFPPSFPAFPLFHSTIPHSGFYTFCGLTNILIEEIIDFICDEIYNHKKLKPICKQSIFKKLPYKHNAYFVQQVNIVNR